MGNTADGVEGVARYAYRKIQIIPTEQVEFGDGISQRQDAPQKENGQLRVASMNVLNYFNGRYDAESDSFDYKKSDAKNASGDYHNNRNDKHYKGLSNDEVEDLFIRQRNKIINAIVAMDADIVGLMEIENDGFGPHSAIQDLVNGINEKLGQDSDRQYAFVSYKKDGKESQIGTDAITTGMLYDINNVKLSGDSTIIDLPTQHFKQEKTKNGKTTLVDAVQAQRPSFVQTFTDPDNKHKLTLVVNHLKSKGTGCLEDEPDNLVEDGQQRCNAFRVSAVKHLGDELKQLKEEGKRSDNTLLIGDFNSYAQEDPVLLLTSNADAQRTLKTASKTSLDGGKTFINNGEPQTLTKTYDFTNLISYKNSGENEKFYSYSYGGELGNLDHAFGSQELLDKITNVQDWHINSVESTMLDYTTKYKPEDKLDSLYSESAFRSSDHDPVIIDIQFEG